jgi:YihY family inner membrane protein
VVKDLLHKIDQFQQRHRPLAFFYGVVRKTGDDRGGSMAALIAYYGFLSLFPLLLIFWTVLSYILPHYPGARHDLEHSVIAQFPVVGDQLKNTDHPLHGSLIALVFGVVGLLWGAMGIAQTLQQVMHDVWNVPEKDRPGFVPRLLRGLLLFAVLGLGIVASTVVTGLGTVLNWGPFGSVLAAIPAALVNIGLFFLVFRVLSPSDIPGKDLVPGAILGGIGWQVLQTVGINLMTHQLRHASQVYGVFGFTLALLSFLSLAATLTVYAAELNVVRARHLWPRSILPEPPTEPDKRVFRERAKQEERLPGQQVTVGFKPSETSATQSG